MDILVRSYTEAGFEPIPSLRLSDEEYGRGLQSFVPMCTDTVLIDHSQRVIYLARRKAKPMSGWWWIGGRMMANETKEESVARRFERETKLALPPNRFKLAAVLDYRWKDRAQQPQTIGCHMCSYVFVVEPTPDELAYVSAHLEENEYSEGSGLVAFDHERLAKEGVVSPILDFYYHVFPPEHDVECGSLKLASSDARRDIHEFEFLDSAFQDFVIKDISKPLGQHFHREKYEIFYFREGGGIIQTAEVDATGAIVGDVKRFEVGPGSIIRIPAMHTHRFDLVRNTRFVAFSSKPFDQKDMIACPIG